VGGRRLRWELGDSFTVTHNKAKNAREIVSYPVEIDYTDLPSGGSRWWWLCPECKKRVDVLYLPKDRERLGCRICCGLKYSSQYGKSGRLKPRPVVSVIRERKLWTLDTGWVVVSRREVKR
jgi:hypothetical protein